MVLEDDRQFFPKYNPALTMREDFAERYPEVAEVMAPISAVLTDDVISELNKQVDVEGEDPATVARQWLVEQGFVTAEG